MILKRKSTAEEVNEEKDRLVELINENIKVAREEEPKDTNDTPPPVMKSNGVKNNTPLGNNLSQIKLKNNTHTQKMMANPEKILPQFLEK